MTTPTILLVDDDADLLQAVSNRCRSIGFDVECARNLLTATAAIARRVPDVVCVDVEMPTGNGLRFCEELATDSRTAHTPIIVVTGRSDAATIDTCRQIGARYQFKSADLWTELEPQLRMLQAPATDYGRATNAGVRPRTLPAHTIPPWPAEADAGRFEEPRSKANHGFKNFQPPEAACRRVVIADDDADLVQLLARRFITLGCSAVGVENALDAINAIYRTMPDLVVLDVNMPCGNGLSICEMMASDERLRSTPVIILTGQTDEKTIRRCHDMLVFYVLKGTDVWGRVEPLVRELLHLGEAPSETPPPAAIASPADDHSAKSSSECDELVDAVFSILGADADNERQVAEASSSTHHDGAPTFTAEDAEVPWVLCIDDDPDFSQALRIRLEEHGVAVVRAASGMEGYCMAFATPASAILLDYSMPNGRGDYILGRLKDNRVTRDLPVIMITGMKDPMLQRRIMAMGATAFFEKPIDFAAIRNCLAKYIPILDNPASEATAIEAVL